MAVLWLTRRRFFALCAGAGVLVASAARPQDAKPRTEAASAPPRVAFFDDGTDMVE
ncbi:MAG: hypothetical protein RL477_2199 [Pseudomonadota bacterium]|jgi:hypothetical protein